MTEPTKRYLVIDNKFCGLEIADNIITIDLPHDFIVSTNRKYIHFMYANIYIITNTSEPFDAA
jgi:hypothetical protein